MHSIYSLFKRLRTSLLDLLRGRRGNPETVLDGPGLLRYARNDEMSKIKIAVLISGDGSNLQALIDACAASDYPAEIVVVLSNRSDAKGLARAQKAGIKTHIVDHKKFETREAFDGALLEALKPYNPELICLAGFMRIVTPIFINAFEGRILNTHPSLLPKFGGEGMYGMHVHKAVIAAGESESGVSIHSVIADVDKGPVILQKSVPVLDNDTPQTLAERVLGQEHQAYPEAVRMVAEKMLNSAQDELD